MALNRMVADSTHRTQARRIREAEAEGEDMAAGRELASSNSGTAAAPGAGRSDWAGYRSHRNLYPYGLTGARQLGEILRRNPHQIPQNLHNLRQIQRNHQTQRCAPMLVCEYQSRGCF